MSKRDFNVFFNLHTVSGIVISIGLYVIFFSGAFTLFMEHINHWEVNEKSHLYTVIDYDKVIDNLTNRGYDMHGRNLSIYDHDGMVNVYARALSDTALTKNKLGLLSDEEARGIIKLQFSKNTYKVSGKDAHTEKSLGRFLYELHFLEQIPVIGRYLSGLISLFFLFAIFTGLILHWKKIVANFFTFRLKSSLKNLWTDGHTALGVVGLPFQIMYAITGAIFGLLVLISFPLDHLLPKERPSKMAENYQAEFLANDISINEKVDEILVQFSDEVVDNVYVAVHNYHDRNGELEVYISTNSIEGIFNYTKLVTRLTDGEILQYKSASGSPPYAEASWDFIHIIHFGDYGGILLKWLYFLLALLTCFVIISGVMIWLVARENKAYAHKSKFNKNVGAIYLGACLGLYPAIAFMFLMTKAFPSDMPHRFGWISWLFLAFWVCYTVYAFCVKRLYKINQYALLLAGVIGILIPVFNGFHAGNWIWESFQKGYKDTFFVDLVWLISGALSLWIGAMLKPQRVKSRKE